MRTSCPARVVLISGGLALAALFVIVLRSGPEVTATVPLVYFARLVIEAAALLWPTRRPELDPRLRRALFVLGGTSILSAVAALLEATSLLSGLTVMTPAIGNGYAVAAYGAFLLGIFLMPMEPFRRGEWLTFGLDISISVGGFAAILLFVHVLPALRAEPGVWLDNVSLAGSASAVLCLLGLNLLTLRGRAVPSRRAFWWLLAGIGSYLLVTLFATLADGQPRFAVLTNGAYVAGVFPTLVASWAMCRDPIALVPVERSPDGLRSFNPFSLGMPVVVGWALLHALASHRGDVAYPLAVTTAVVTTLLVVRLVLTIRENDRRLRDQARRDLQAESDRLESLRRVAAGVAHAFNNSLTVVLGEADLGIASRPAPAAERAFVQIRRAGDRSAALTRHLLWFTGRQHRRQAPIEIATWLRALQPDLRAAAGPSLSLEIDAGRGEAWLDGDEAQLREVMLELVRNASEAAGGRGTVHITRTELRFEDPAPRGLRDPLPSGPYACLSVRDSGRGMEPEVVARVFDPFFSSRRADPSAGLGLSLAYGVVRAHGGRIEVESTPGRGSEFRVLLPLSAGAPARR